MELSKRLSTVASAVTPGHRIADVGTDHGYVPIYLVGRNICPGGLAMDVNAGPLERATEHIREEGLSGKIETRLSNGMEKISRREVDTVVIAGMGGDLICRILQARADLLEEGMEFILQPQSEWFKVRHTLHDYGYQITKEWFLKEEGKYYVVLKAVPGVQAYEHDYEYAYGVTLEEMCWPVYEEYLEKEKKKRQEIYANLEEKKDEKNLCRMEQRLEEICMEIDTIEKRLRAGR